MIYKTVNFCHNYKNQFLITHSTSKIYKYTLRKYASIAYTLILMNRSLLKFIVRLLGQNFFVFLCYVQKCKKVY